MIALKVECRESLVFSWLSKFVSMILGCEICILGPSARREMSIHNGWCFCCFGVRVIIDFIHIPSEQALPTSVPEKSNLNLPSSLQFKSSRLELPFLRKIEATTPSPAATDLRCMPGPDHTCTRERCVVIEMRTSQYALFPLETAGSQWPMANKDGISGRVISAVRVCGEGRSP